MGRGRLFHCARFCLERSEVGEGLRTETYLTDSASGPDLKLIQ